MNERQMSLFDTNISVPRAAEIIRCSEDTVLRLLEEGALKGYRLTRRGWWRVNYSSVVDYLGRLQRELQ